MRIKLDDRFIKPFADASEVSRLAEEARSAAATVASRTGAGSEMLGWYSLPRDYDREEYARILAAAEKIRKTSQIFIVIGVGGSYLGSRAVIEFIKSPRYNSRRDGTPEIWFSGCNLSASDMEELTALCDGKDICINVISKSGTTTESAIAFRFFRQMIEKKYGADGARERIFVTTDKCRGTLKAFADAAGYETFVVPDGVGGRYSVLTAVGLLPIAVAGIDTGSLIAGAEQALSDLTETPADMSNPAIAYAVYRNAMLGSGKDIEIFVGYEPYELMFSEWWKQLFGESEGKDGKGLFPASVNFSTDLHSLGQYIQQGRRTMFETVLSIESDGSDIAIPDDRDNIDGLNFISGMKMSDVNRTAMNGTLLAHFDGEVPEILLHIADRSELSLGYMIYFFEYACAVSGYMLGVNPFDQPGVESYKKNMFALLGKPGYSDMAEKLRARLK